MIENLLIPVFAALLGSPSHHAAGNVLVASNRSYPVCQVSTTGTVSKLIYGTAPPALGNDHIWVLLG